jgi:hypothetical protein
LSIKIKIKIPLYFSGICRIFRYRQRTPVAVSFAADNRTNPQIFISFAFILTAQFHIACPRLCLQSVRDIACLIGGQKQRKKGYFFRFSHSVQGNLFYDFFLFAWGKIVVHIGICQTGRYAVYRNPAGRNLLARAFVRPIIAAFEAE